MRKDFTNTGAKAEAVSKESACNVGVLGLIPELGRYPGEENDYPLQFSCLENSMGRTAWQTTVHGVTNSQTQLRRIICNAGDPGSILGPLEKEMATHSSILTWEIPWTEEPGGLQSLGLKKSLETKQHQYSRAKSKPALKQE